MYSNLKLRLWQTGMRQHQLADRIGINETLLSKIINGHRKPDRKIRAAIARELDSTEEWLFEASPTDSEKDPNPQALEGLVVKIAQARTGQQ